MHKTIGVASVLLVSGCNVETTVVNQQWTDSFGQAPNNQVDILWVIDDSSSMIEEQTTLQNGFSAFAGELDDSKTDFHLGVVTTSFIYTDPDRGKLIGDPPYLTNADDYESEFIARAAVGVDGSDKEKGLEVAQYALSPTMTLPGGKNAGFVRKDAQLLVVIVSDEEDCSDGGALEGQPANACYDNRDELMSVSQWVTDMRALKRNPGDFVVGSIVGLTSSSCPDVFPGTRYVSAALLTGGLAGDICRSDWDSMLTNLGLNATGIHTTFQLSYAAIPSSIQVFVDDTEILEDPVDGWTYDVPSWYLTFHGSAVPPRGAAIVVNFTKDPGRLDPVVPTTTAPVTSG